MAIAKMQKITFLADERYQDDLMRSIQAMENIQVLPLTDFLEKEDRDTFNFGDAENKVIQYQQTLRDIREKIEVLEQYVKAKGNFFQRLTAQRPRYSLKELEEKVKASDVLSITHRVETIVSQIHAYEEELEELREDEDFLRKWQNLNFVPKETEDFELFQIVVASLDPDDEENLLNALSETMEVYTETIFEEDDELALLFLFEKKSASAFRRITRQYSFDVLDYPFKEIPQVELERSQNRQEELKKAIAEEKELLASLDDELEALKLGEEYYYALAERERAKEKTLSSDNFFAASGWIPEDYVDQQIKMVEETIGSEEVAILVEDVKESELNEVPVTLQNNSLVKPFESTTKQFGLPKYNSIDPTPFFYPFHLIFFGMMSADLGYGLILFLGTLFALRKIDMNDEMRNNIKMFNQMSIFTMLIGTIYGSFFGFTLPIPHVDMTSNVIPILLVSIVIGLVHLALAYGIQVYLMAKEKNYTAMYLDGFQWIFIIAGVFILGLNLFVQAPVLNTIGLVMILGNVVAMLLVNIFSSQNKLAGVGKGLFGLMDYASMLGDIVSYSRLMALGISGANIAFAFNLVVSLFPPVLRFTIGILVFIALHALNIFITYLSAYVHSMRLEFVEFFGKFYVTGGKEFKPLSTLEKNIKIKK